MGSASERNIRDIFKRWPRFYIAVMYVIGPLLFTGLSAKKFLGKYPSGGKKLNLGSGSRRVAPDVTNVDFHDYTGVDLVADIRSIPLADGSVSRIISDTVLEHVANPAVAVKEMYRLLESGGLAYIAVPFLYPFHSAPNDYQRWTKQGLIELFSDFEMVEIGVRGGPFSALVAYLSHLCGVLFSFGVPVLDSLISNAVLLIFFPIKFLDLIFAHVPNAENVAGALYCVIRKR